MNETRHLEMTEILQMIDSCRGKNRVRNQALMILLTYSGGRISEVVSLRRKDLLDIDGKLKERFNFIKLKAFKRKRKGKRINRTKGNPTRTAIIPEMKARILLEKYLYGRSLKALKAADAYIFPGKRKKGTERKHLSRVSAWFMIRRLAQANNITGAVGAHSFRKAYGQLWFQFGISERLKGKAVNEWELAREALGHTDIRATQCYLKFMRYDPCQNASEVFKDFSKKLAAII